jgi:hypothetical protein
MGCRGDLRNVVSLVLLFVGWQAVSASANQIFVEADLVEVNATDGLCSLIEALENAIDETTGLVHDDCVAGDPSSGDVVELAPGSVYTLLVADNTVSGGNGLPVISNDVAINGNGSTIDRPSTAPNFRILLIEAAGALALNDLTISGGSASGAFQQGGAIRNAGSLSVENSTMRSCRGNSGGAIFNVGALAISDASLDSNSASIGGGALFNSAPGTVNIDASNISNNQAELNGGGVFNGSGVVMISFSSLHGNVAVGGAGGAVENRGDVAMTNSTLSGNVAMTGGGISISDFGNTSMTACTVADNENGNVQLGPVDAATLSLSNTIIADARTGDDCNAGTQGVIADLGFNVVEDGTCITEASSMAGDPLLGPLQNNGGSSLTHALLPGSQAIEGGDCAGGSVTMDQRGVARPQASTCDVGAFELEEAQLSIEAASDFENIPTLAWTVTRTHNAHDVTVVLVTADGTALDGLDYDGVASVTVTLAAGAGLSTSGDIAITDEALVELDESFDVQISNPSQAVIAVPAATATIINDDSAAILISDVANLEGAEGLTTPFDFVATADAPIDVDISFTAQTVDGTATVAGDDYLALSQPVTILAGGMKADVQVDVPGDDRLEAGESFTVELSELEAQGRDVTLIDAEGLGTILNDDSITVSFELAESKVTEQDVTHLVNVSLMGTTDVMVSVEVVDEGTGSASPGEDYVAFDSQTVTFMPGATDGDIAVAAIDVIEDDEDEEEETIALAIDAGSSPDVMVGEPSQHVVTILDDDEGGSTSATMNIRPDDCPNNVAVSGNGFLPVALAGDDGFDVSMVDLSSLVLIRTDGLGGEVVPRFGGPGPKPQLTDLVSPYEVVDCACELTKADGITDLRISFYVKEVVGLFDQDELDDGAVELALTGALTDGSSFVAVDCVTWVGIGPAASKPQDLGSGTLNQPLPRPPACGAFSPLAFVMAFSWWTVMRGRRRVRPGDSPDRID